MITFLYQGCARGVTTLLASAGPELTQIMEPLSYLALFRQSSIPAGAYIFADIERLPNRLIPDACKLWEILEASEQPTRLLNDPRRVMRRYELLRTLYERGVNAFNVLPLAGASAAFPRVSSLGE